MPSTSPHGILGGNQVLPPSRSAAAFFGISMQNATSGSTSSVGGKNQNLGHSIALHERTQFEKRLTGCRSPSTVAMPLGRWWAWPADDLRPHPLRIFKLLKRERENAQTSPSKWPLLVFLVQLPREIQKKGWRKH